MTRWRDSVVIGLAFVLFAVAVRSQDQNNQLNFPYISLNGVPLLNNSLVQDTDVQINSSGVLLCHTNLSTCCNNGSYSGRWIGLGGVGTLPADFFQQRTVEGGVELFDVQPIGSTYRCEIDTIASVARGGPRDVVYVGINRGFLVYVSLSVEVVQTEPPLYTLLCRTVFSPATSVTWRRGSEVIPGGVTTSIRHLRYHNELNVTEEGVYSCEVFTNFVNRIFIPDNETATINATTPLPPANLTVIQTGPYQLTVSWTPTGRPSHYRIFYRGEGPRTRIRQESVGPNDTSAIIDQLVFYDSQNYSISMVAETALRSSVVGPVVFPLGRAIVRVRNTATLINVFYHGAYLGQPVRVTCLVQLVGSALGPPTIVWRAPFPVPTPMITTLEDGTFQSEFIIESFNESHDGSYICEASVDNLHYSSCNQNNIHLSLDSRLSLEYSIAVNNRDPLQFTIICESFGGIPTNVTWTKNSTVVEGGVTVLSDDFRNYVHSLNATEEGLYTCTVSNDTPDNVTSFINATFPNPPSNVTVVQSGRNSVLVTWTPSDGAEYYTLIYRDTESTFSRDISITIPDGATDSYTLSVSNFIVVIFSYRLTANTALPSPETDPVEFSIRAVRAVISTSDSSAYVGWDYTLFCHAILQGNFTEAIEFTWSGPGGRPVRTGATLSELRFNKIRLSQAGAYRCTVTIEGFPYVSSTDDLELNIRFLVPRPFISVKANRDGPYYVGTSLNLTCNIPLNPAIDLPVIDNVQWVINGTVVEPHTEERVTVTERTIEFFPLDFPDSATYRCDVQFITENFHQRSQEFQLQVEDLPALEVELLAPPVGVAGDSLTIDCQVTAVPHLISTPQVRLVGPQDTLLHHQTGYNVSETLGPLTTSDAGQQYVCKAELEIESIDVSQIADSDNYTVTVQIPEPDVIIITESSTTEPPLLAGYHVTLICQTTLNSYISHYTSVEITWQGPPSGMSRGEKYMSIEGQVHRNNLTIYNLQEEDGGVYTCHVNIIGTDNVIGINTTGSISLDIFTPTPPLVEIDGPSVVLSDDSVTITCAIIPAPQIRQKLEEPSLTLFSEGVSLVTTSGLDLTYTTNRLGPGIHRYFCSSVVKVEGLETLFTSQSSNHTVFVPPQQLLEITGPSIVPIGTSVTIACSVTTTPELQDEFERPQLSIFKDGRYLATNPGLNLVYTIDSVQLSQAGSYSCVLVFTVQSLGTPYESQSLTHNLTVFNHSVEIERDPSSSNVVGGDYVKLYCRVKASIISHLVDLENSTVVLLRSGLPIASNTGLDLAYFASSIRASQAGLYSCLSLLKVDGINKPFVSQSLNDTLIVAVSDAAISISSRPLDIKNVSVGSEVTLTCEIKFRASFDVVISGEVKWSGPRLEGSNKGFSTTTESSEDNQVFTGVLTILSVVEEDEGEYGCSLSYTANNEYANNTAVPPSSIQLGVFEPPTEHGDTEHSGTVLIQWSRLSLIVTIITAILFH